ncbi:hypothetical protein [Eupransor demetentiae]|uniref:Uncharacterized protein n=1 Tax=Eupransor demetentiae TaxID=3109584 RepID=A0ABM9N3I5_9LACO|nr:hypothetical protein R54876_GBNLAHCA_00265 [Lactobacillaceae bacterium LMG 33000]
MATKKQKKSKSMRALTNPFYKQPWFWMVVLVILLVVGAVFGYKAFQGQKAQVQETTPTQADVNKDPKKTLKQNAETFGTLSQTDLKADPQKYIAKSGGEGSMVYVWRVDSGTSLVRIDTADGNTKVYKYAQDTDEMLKNELYSTN